MGDVKVAVIGLGSYHPLFVSEYWLTLIAGPAGLTAIKALREEGFGVQGFERRDCVGGVWSKSQNASYTSVIQETITNTSRFTVNWPPYLTGSQVAEFLQAYATKFQLHQYIRFNTTVRVVLRDDADAGPKQFAGQRVLVVGLGNTACDVSLSVAREASCVYQSYRSGRMIISRYDDDGIPTDPKPWPKAQLTYLLRDRLPWLAMRLEKRLLVKTMVGDAARQRPRREDGDSERRRRLRAEEKIRGEWRLMPCPTEFAHPTVHDDFISALDSGRVTPVRGFKEFAGADEVLLDDGSTIRVDAVVFCTGYTLDFGIMPELEMDGCCGLPLKMAADQRQTKAQQAGEEKGAGVGTREKPTLPRLYHMLFPPRWASSVAILSWMSTFETAWCVSELASTAVSQVWAADVASKLTPGSLEPGKLPSAAPYREPARLPTEAEMNAAVDKHHAWWRRGWAKEPSAHPGLIQPWLTKGPGSNHAWRVFETNPLNIPGCGRRAWPGARQALQDAVSRLSFLSSLFV
ncbi:uncharacterized protein B0H64DRAFT_415341 [Chaetomium fimeti]|uniref:Uncharacterized protein n=1 Tax=Chaetomium fimeti TaxID=1854472 RepID=A0AAE0HLL2_9PEZI|nr:hypothetical protein B0H64DRAFT_415341 [Chaetomium fimeti]